MIAYILTIDGTTFWMPVEVREVSKQEYLILDTHEFDPEDTSTLMQFIPGDVVRVDNQRAYELIASSYPDRDYLSFLFSVVLGKPPNVDFAKSPYKEIIDRISREVSESTRYHYPAVHDWVRAQQYKIAK